MQEGCKNSQCGAQPRGEEGCESFPNPILFWEKLFPAPVTCVRGQDRVTWPTLDSHGGVWMAMVVLDQLLFSPGLQGCPSSGIHGRRKHRQGWASTSGKSSGGDNGCEKCQLHTRAQCWNLMLVLSQNEGKFRNKNLVSIIINLCATERGN